MSPTSALQSPVFLFYLGLAASLLVLGGCVLAVLKWGLRRNVGHAWRAYVGWLLVVPLLLLVFFLGREAAIIFVILLALLGFGEFARATGLGQDRVLTWAACSGIVAMGVACLLRDPATGKAGWYGLFMALPVFVSAAILAIPVIRNRAAGQFHLVALAIVGFVYLGWMFGHLAFLANSASAYGYLGYLVLAVELNDVAAYVCGKWFGRYLLRSNISPKKTWEGAIGAVAVSILLAWALRFTLPEFGTKDCLLIGLIVGIGGQVGDLVVSLIKREHGIKDMGALIPGHGGILDRIDSLIYVAPLFFYYTRYREGFGFSP